MPASLPDDVDRLILYGNHIGILTSENATKHGSLEKRYLPHISKLDISYNNVTNISKGFFDIFISSKNLKVLDISQNRLNSLPKNIQNISSLDEIMINGNEFICSCDNIWMKDWILNHTDLVTDYRLVKCTMPDNRDIPVIQTNQVDLGCIPEEGPFAIWKIVGTSALFHINSKENSAG